MAAKSEVAEFKAYLTNDDGTVKVRAIHANKEQFEEIHKNMEEYKWVEGDFLLASYQKNGTHFMWEIMTMLLRGSAEYIRSPKEACMIDLFPLKKTDAVFPSPRVLNTHYRLDVLPKEFRGRKTVLVIRNPKDTSVSMYFHRKNVWEQIKKIEPQTLSQILSTFLHDKDTYLGSYFDYTEYMWSLRDDPNMLVIFFEDLILINIFSDKPANMAKISEKMYRKGKIGDWKNHLTVAENEMFDEFLAKWPLSKEIKFTFV
ncbi:hypothetical protein EB796_004962 [Bugula neritina]|uniref:Sulfotransferase domain-containing protein n=1 Tax=Bugula neritina TaxID=10212 RepID=A0A7J7KDI5_BUGNE|nr:hypothetical protein EB796_004962 [Bugula neritina]